VTHRRKMIDHEEAISTFFVTDTYNLHNHTRKFCLTLVILSTKWRIWNIISTGRENDRECLLLQKKKPIFRVAINTFLSNQPQYLFV